MLPWHPETVCGYYSGKGVGAGLHEIVCEDAPLVTNDSNLFPVLRWNIPDNVGLDASQNLWCRVIRYGNFLGTS